ncbi:MAG: lysophospholipid acyltransferase family protein [Candidatus Eisenbacteria sp.]|nr:lysophospholipid acyltransferase family protein [Candidatus Eisenbacteria bacterium]
MGIVALWFYRLAAFLARCLPPGLSYVLADRVADLYFWIRRRPRCALLANLQVVTGARMDPADRRRLAKVIFRNFGRSIVDFLRLPAMDRSTLNRQVRAEGLERLEEALQSRGGVVLLTAHIGGWEVGGAYLSALGYPVNAIARNHDATHITRFFNTRREERGIRVLGTGERNRELLRLLEQGECIALLGDWDGGGRGTWATFFGREARVPFAYVKFAERTGGQIVPGVAIRNPTGGYRVRLDGSIKPTPGNARSTLDRCLRVLEQYISENLTQWFAFNPIWPEEAPNGKPGS